MDGYLSVMELRAVHDLVMRPGPFVTVQAEVGRTAEDAGQQRDARWTTIRQALENEGVGAALIAEIGERLHQPPLASGPCRRTLIAADGEVVLDDVLNGETRWPEVASVDPLPDLAGWVALADRQVPFALVVADRAGADVEFHTGLADTEVEETVGEGDNLGIAKLPQGDWKHLQYQRAVENTWQRSAYEIAAAVRSGVRRHHPAVVIVAGEGRMCGQVVHALDGSPVPIVQIRGGGRGLGASEDALWADVRRVLAEWEARRDDDVAQELQARTGRGSGAARGLHDVLDALVTGQVQTLVLDLDAARELTVDPAEHPGLPLPEGASGDLPADRVLIAAAAATDADVCVLPRFEAKGAGVAALLRRDQR